jgi:hypothetical protein
MLEQFGRSSQFVLNKYYLLNLNAACRMAVEILCLAS